MKALLVNSDFSGIDEADTMPLAMYALGAAAREYNHEIEILDPGLYRKGFYKENIDEMIVKEGMKSDCVAFSVNSFTWSRVKLHIKRLRHNNYTGAIIVGGVHPTRLPNYVMNTAQIDYLLRGEGEVSFPLLLDVIEQNGDLSTVPNLVYRKNKELIYTEEAPLLDLDRKIPIPAYDLVPKGSYKQWSIESSRGCIGNCSFCSIIYKKCWRGYDSKEVIKRMNNAEAILQTKNMPQNIDFTDDYFFTDNNRAVEILTEMSKGKFEKYRFIVESRIKDTYKETYIKAFKKLNGMSVQFGVECGYDEGLIKIKKGILRKDIYKAAKILYDNGLNPRVFFSFIIGFPWESKEQIFFTLETAANIRVDYQIHTNVSWWMPLPSEEFEILRGMKSEVGYDIFDKVDWHKDVDLFMQTHPQIDTDDREEINLIIKRFSEAGYKLRL